jgi:hypothetical protein
MKEQIKEEIMRKIARALTKKIQSDIGDSNQQTDEDLKK